MPRFRYQFPENTTSAKAGQTSTISVFLPGTSTPIPDTLFADGSSGSTLANPFTTTSAKPTFFLAMQRPVRVTIANASSGVTHAADQVAPDNAVQVYAVSKVNGQVASWVLG